jgi:LPS-assembly protein
MIKIILILLVIVSSFASEIEMFGAKSVSKNNVTTVYDGVLFKDAMIVSAKKIVYDKNKNIVIAKDNVYINYDKNDYILANIVKIDLNTNNIQADPFFFFNYKDNGWINAKKAFSTNNIYNAKTAIASTCSVNNPDWRIEATSVDYNKQTKWINLYNPRLFLKGIPILYLPYLGFSLDKTRHSGFLRPLIGYSANEGLLLTVPYYQVLGEAADLEIDPTIRNQRGKGIYTTFRFVHSTTSRGEFKIGEFTDKKYYQEKYNLLNQTHKGWSFLYTNHDLIDSSDQLYISLKNANDTDYFYLDAYNYTFNSIGSKTLTSNINYYIMNDFNYLGVYAKYFKDTSKVSNSDTMQILPQVNYHRFSDNFWNKFSFSVDANVYNYTRREGYKAVKQAVVFPLSYNNSFFNDYLKFGITEQFNFNQVTTNDGNVSKYYNSNTIIKLYSNLSKRYSSFNHHIAPSITFNMNNKKHFNGVESPYLDKTKLQKSVTFALNQYLIADNWSITHNISQTYYLENNNTKYSNILNDVSGKYFDFYISDNNRYAPSTNDITYNSFRLGYNDNIHKIEYNRIYKKNVDSPDRVETYNVNGYWKFDNIHKFFAQYSYDLVLNMQKYYIIGLSMKKKCWNYSVSYKKEILPLLTADGISNITQKTIYFEIELVPLGGIKQQYQFKTKKAE